MRLRELQDKDAPLMLEWMHDDNVTNVLQAGKFSGKTLNDCDAFIAAARDESHYIHRAIVDDNDEYMGTVSLRDITKNDAEFAIAIRSCAMGRGIAIDAMRETLRIGFEELGLQEIYWCVRPENTRAIRFYDKNRYQRIDVSDLKNKGGTARNNCGRIFGTRCASTRSKTAFDNQISLLSLNTECRFAGQRYYGRRAIA